VSPTVEGLRRELEHLQGGEVTDATLARSAEIVRELRALEGPKPEVAPEAPVGEVPVEPQTITGREGEKAPEMPAGRGAIPRAAPEGETPVPPEGPSVGEGPGAAPRGFGPYPAIKQLQDQLKAAPKVGTRERIAWGER